MSGGEPTEIAVLHRVLTVGDSVPVDTTRSVLEDRFGPQTVLEARSVPEAFDLLEREKEIHCLTCDADVETIEALRIEAPEVPILAVVDGYLTARQRESIVDESIAAGAHDVIDSSAPPAVVATRAANAIDHYRDRRAAEREGPSSAFERTVLDATDAIVIVLDEATQVAFASSAIERETGYTPDDLIRRGTWTDWFVHPEDRETVGEVIEAVVEEPTGSTRREPIRLRHADDSWHVYDVTMDNRLDDPTVEGIVLTVIDRLRERAASVIDPGDVDRVRTDLEGVREREREPKSEREREPKSEREREPKSEREREPEYEPVRDHALSELLDGIDTPVFVVGPQSELRYANRASGDWLDRPTTEAIGTVVWDLLPEAMRGDLYERVQEARERDEVVSFELDVPSEVAGDGASSLTVDLHPVGESVTVYARTTAVDAAFEARRERFSLLEGVLDALDVGIFVFENSTVTMANAPLFELLDEDVLVGRDLESIFDAETSSRLSRRAETKTIRVTEPIESDAVVDGERTPIDLTVTPLLESDGAVAVVRSRTERPVEVESLSTLERVIGELIEADRRADVSRAVVDAVSDLAGIETAVWYRDVDGQLRPEATAPDESFVTELEPVDLDIDEVIGVDIDESMELDRTGRESVFDRVPGVRVAPREAIGPILAQVAPRAENALCFPIGATGFVIATSIWDAFDEGTAEKWRPDHYRPEGREKVDRWNGPDFEREAEPVGEPDDEGTEFESATTVGRPDGRLETIESIRRIADLAVERLRLESAVADREWTLTERSRRLDRFESVFDRVRTIERAVWSASDRTEGLERVCDELIDLDWISFVWVGEPDWGTGAVMPIASAGPSATYLDADTFDVAEEAVEPVGRTAATGEPTVIDDVAREPRRQTWRRTALDHGFRSICCVPIVHGPFRFGTLTMYANEPFAFDETDVSTLTHLGQSIGFGMHAIHLRRALITGSITELELIVRTDDPLVEVAKRLDRRVDIHSVVPRSNDRVTVFLSTPAPQRERSETIDELETVDSVSSVRPILDAGDDLRLEVDFAPTGIVGTIAAHGGTLQSVASMNDHGRFVVTLHGAVDVRTFVETLDRVHPGTSLYARRTRESSESRLPFEIELQDQLTDRQLRTLKTAYYAGFFEWPREHTGEEIAELLEVSQPTFNRHFRSAERKLYSLLFDEYALEE